MNSLRSWLHLLAKFVYCNINLHSVAFKFYTKLPCKILCKYLVRIILIFLPSTVPYPFAQRDGKTCCKNTTHILRAGDIALFCGITHCIQNANADTHRLIDVTYALQSMSGAFLVNQVGSQTDCTMLCLNFYADKHSSLLANLPDFFIVTLNEQTLHPLVKLISNEAQNPNQIGNAFLMDNLAQSILVYVLRALPNEKLGGALKAHQHPRLSELITQIAIETGFGPQTHFNRAFKAHYGVSPSTYRLTPISMQ